MERSSCVGGPGFPLGEGGWGFLSMIHWAGGVPYYPMIQDPWGGGVWLVCLRKLMEGCLLRCSALTSSWSYLHREIRLYSDIDKKLEDMGIFCGDVRAGLCPVLVVLHLPHWFFFRRWSCRFTWTHILSQMSFTPSIPPSCISGSCLVGWKQPTWRGSCSPASKSKDSFSKYPNTCPKNLCSDFNCI